MNQCGVSKNYNLKMHGLIKNLSLVVNAIL